MTKKSVLEMYALSVCFVAAVSFVFATSFLLYDVVRVLSPGFTLDWYFAQRYANNDKYWEYVRPHCYGERTQNCEDSAERPAEVNLTRGREAALAIERSGERRRGWQGLVQALLLVLVDGAVFGLHWRFARRARENNGSQHSAGRSFAVSSAREVPG